MQHVRISKKAREVLGNRNLARKIAEAIGRNGSELSSGKSISVDNIVIKSSLKTNDGR